jgi:hypothetical protein
LWCFRAFRCGVCLAIISTKNGEITMSDDDLMGAAMSGANGPFPDKAASSAPSWEKFRGLDKAVDRINANQPATPSALAGQGSDMSAPATPAPMSPAAALAGVVPTDMGIPAQMRLSSPEMVARSLPQPGAERYQTLLDLKHLRYGEAYPGSGLFS